MITAHINCIYSSAIFLDKNPDIILKKIYGLPGPSSEQPLLHVHSAVNLFKILSKYCTDG